VAKIKAYLIYAVIIVVALRIILWAVEPMVPYLVALLILVGILGLAVRGKRKL